MLVHQPIILLSRGEGSAARVREHVAEERIIIRGQKQASRRVKLAGFFRDAGSTPPEPAVAGANGRLTRHEVVAGANLSYNS